MFSKAPRYYYDAEAVRTPLTERTIARDGATPRGRFQNGGGSAESLAGNSSAVLELRGASPDAGANLRNFWLLSPEPSREEHYAAFPTEIPRRCIKAGTSERGACPSCGAGWVRQSQHRYESIPGGSAYGKGNNRVKAGDLDSMAAGRRFENRAARVVETLGWQPGCSCPPADPVPCVVLDCFGGSGTTGLVADRLGRDAILIELSPTYVDMARRRLESDAPMVSDPVTVEQPTQGDLFAEVAG